MGHADRASDLAVRWHRSSHSAQGSDCVEIGVGATLTAVRDSKNPHGPALLLTPTTRHALLTAVTQS